MDAHYIKDINCDSFHMWFICRSNVQYGDRVGIIFWKFVHRSEYKNFYHQRKRMLYQMLHVLAGLPVAIISKCTHI